MKYLIILLFILSHINLLGQTDFFDLEETFWLNENDEYINFAKIKSSETFINLLGIMNEDLIEFHMLSDTIAFRSMNEYFHNEDNPGYTIKLIVQERTDTTLFLAKDELNQDSTNQKKLIKLYNSIANQYIDQFQLKSISINRSGESIHIDSLGKIEINKGWASDIPMKYNNESEFGYYKGKLSEAQLFDIKYSLFRIGILDGLELDNFKVCSHCQDKTLEIEFNDSKLIGKYNWAKVVLFPFHKEIRKYCNIEKLNKVK
jgi:hypothetical protein